MSAPETLDDFFEIHDQEDEQMDAASLLPLMLQAQDLVAKLESRVVELENDLETINEAHEQERDQLLQEIGEKDEYIHNLKTKASRLEFGAREAIIVLARTVEILKAQNIDDDEDSSKEDDDNATAVESTDFEGQFLDSIKLCLNYLKNAQSNQVNQKVSKTYKKHSPSPSPLPLPPPTMQSTPVRRDSKLQSSNDDDSDHKVDITTPPQDNEVGDLQEQEVEDQSEASNNIKTKSNRSRRESFNGSQISLDDIPDLDEYGLDGSEDIADFAMSDEEDNGFRYHSPLSRRQSIDSEQEEEERRRENAFSNEFHNSTDVGNEHDRKEEVEQDDESDEEDERHHRIHDLLPPPGPVPDISQTNLCPNCNTLLAQVDQHIEERAYLKRDLSALAVSLTEEQTLRAQVQASKDYLEMEIDEWINAMFEKVNQMVFDEANSREELELLNRETKGKMENALKSSGSRQDRLRELKLLLVHLDSTKQRQAAPTLNGSLLNRNSVVRRSLMSNSPVHSARSSRIFGNFGHMSPSIFSSNSIDEVVFAKSKRVYIDGVVFEEFQEYIKSFVTSPAPSNSTPTHPFMKRCMAVDIQPCLFEGSSSWKSPFYKRRLLDAIMKNQCEIQTVLPSTANSIQSTPNTSQISNSTSNTRQSVYYEQPQAPTVKCGLCGHLRSCEYRMRLSGTDVAVPPTATMTPSSRFSVTGSPAWIPLDRFCRDRVVAVCDFYAYLSHLRQGLLVNSPVWGIYKQCLKHRRRMSLARVGGVSMLDDDENIGCEYLNNPEVEGMVVIVH
ncbi:10762_t:CDS:2 [Acaulospora morrowiae]|uniref:10762_t:CDS:1 n=1 Tax=Acaulospora morrowiae TaxID=94023 RepID=A0A9N9AM22_9GLOM|nr:10762_t:CDS:2 [Acaulospora morrowiae]